MHNCLTFILKNNITLTITVTSLKLLNEFDKKLIFIYNQPLCKKKKKINYIIINL